MEVKDKDNIIASMKDDKYKKLVYDFCAMLKKHYNIDTKLEVEEYVDGFRDVQLVRLSFIAPFVDDKLNKQASYSIVIYTYHFCKKHYDDQHTREECRFKKPSWRKIFNKMFLDNLFKELRFFAAFGDSGYETPKYKIFDELRLALDLDAVLLSNTWNLPNTKPMLKLVAQV